jgi:aminoglycoside phosphotransferase (APT) family kinase protein
MIERGTDTALAWAEAVVGGQIVERSLQARWRPHWFLTIAKPDGTTARVMLRGFRNPGYLGPEDLTRAWLRREAAALDTLQTTPVKVPHYYGYLDEFDWILMEWVQGDELLTDVADSTRRHALFDEYMENVATLHGLALDELDLDAELMPVPSPGTTMRGSARMATQAYRAASPPGTEPLLELGVWWVEHHVPEPARATAFCGGDIGPNQFIFDEVGVKSMFDLELAHLGDPYEDLGLMRMREMCYPIGGLPDHLHRYADRTGAPLDIEALRYWTVVGMITGPLVCWGRVTHPDPTLPDQIPLFSWDPIYRRGLAEALMEVYAVPLDPPDLPAPRETERTKLHDLLVGQMHDFYVPTLTEPEQQFRARGTAALAETLARGDAVGPQLEQATLDELGEVLGAAPDDLPSGLARLDASVRADPEHDIERRLRFFHRMQVRHEFLYEPIQASMGFASNQPLARVGAG